MAEVLGKANLFTACNFSQKKKQEIFGFCLRKNIFPSLKVKSQAFNGHGLVFSEKKGVNDARFRLVPLKAQMPNGLIGKTPKWWEKGVQPNMKEVTSAEDLVDSLLNAGDQLVIVDFFSPGCGGCKALHPKICQLAEMNPDVQFLQVNHEEHKSMCYSLNVNVLPFFRFYRGVEGRLCSFSCTNATIKKFRDALAKYKPDRSSLGPTKGLDETELLALAANKDLSFNYTPMPVQPALEMIPVLEEKIPTTPFEPKESEEKTLVGVGR